MGRVYEAFPGDPDVAALYADALMNLTPWELWDLRTGSPAAGAQTARAREVLDRALESPAGRAHPGVLHMYIHLMEMSPYPERARPAAERLRGLVPDSGHLHHMPTHLDVLCGDYARVVASNAQAIAADEKYAARNGAMNFYTLYRVHDYHFKIYGAMFLGQAQTALADRRGAGGRDPGAVAPGDLAADGGLAGGLPGHAGACAGAVRPVAGDPGPAAARGPGAVLGHDRDAALRPSGVACSALGRVAEAERERERFAAARAAVPASRMIFNNTCADVLAIAAAMLDGELEYRKGNTEAAFAHLRTSIALDDGLPYDEPWGWMQPTRHAYGALLLEQGRVAEAEAVYRADLGFDDTLPRAYQHPGNIWSLHGYHECLVKLGQTDAAEIIGQQLRFAAAMADTPVQASCFCRLNPDPCHA